MRRLNLFTVIILLALSISTLMPVQGQEPRSFTLMFHGTSYNRIQEFVPFGGDQAVAGAARRATVIKQIREKYPDAILLSTGGDLMGTTMFIQYGGSVTAEVFSRLGYNVVMANQLDILAGGNTEGFETYLSSISYPTVNSNLDVSQLNLNIPTETVLTAGDLKIGVFGMTSETAIATANFAGTGTVRDTEQTVQKEIDILKRQNVDAIVMLSDLGMTKDIALAEKHPEITVIAGTDANSVLGDAKDLAPNTQSAGAYPMVVNKTLLIYAGNNGLYLGELHVELNADNTPAKWEGKPYYLSSEVTPDPEMKAYIDKLSANISLNNNVIGSADTDIIGNFLEHPYQELPLVDIWADAYLETGKQYGATIALVNQGTAWAAIAKGDITLGQVYQVVPFSNWLYIADIQGKYLLEAIENGLSRATDNDPNIDGRFLHVAGMTYSYDLSKPVGERVVEVLVDGKPLDPEATYTFAANDFMINGGDGYTVLVQHSTNLFNTGLSITDDVLRTYIQNHSPLTAPEPRLKNLTK